MNDERKFYRVINGLELWYATLPNHLEQGYEDPADFRRAVRRIVDRWHDRIGESVETRHGLHLLRFHDTPGGMPDEAWVPAYLLNPADMPAYVGSSSTASIEEEIEAELDEAFGF